MLSLLLATVITGCPSTTTPVLGPNSAAQIGDAWTSQGSIQSREFQNERRDDNGNVLGTEFYTFTYNVSLKMVRTDDINKESTPRLSCNQMCNGNVHKNHSECDFSCDTRCSQIHVALMPGKYDKNVGGGRTQAIKDSATLANALGAPGGDANWSSTSSKALRKLESETKKGSLIGMEHRKEPCGIDHGYFQTRKHEVWVKGEFVRNGYYMSHGIKAPLPPFTKSHENHIDDAWIPDGDPYETDHVVVCLCFKEVKKEPKTPKPPTETITKPKDNRTPTYSGLGWRKADGTLVIPDEKKVSVRTTGNGINFIEIEATNKDGEPIIAFVDPGTVATPTESKYQIMVVSVYTEVMIPGRQTAVLRIPAGPSVEGAVAGNLRARAVCSEMMKLPPDSATEFNLKPAQDDGLTALCEQINASRFRGPWNQARIWIYKDKATLDQINEHLIPGISPRQYEESLYDVQTVSGIDMSKPEWNKLFGINLLSEAGARPNADLFVVEHEAEFDKRALIGFADSSASAMNAKIAAAADKDDLVHAAMIARGMMESDDNEVRLAGARYALGAVPEAKRADFAKETGLDSIDGLIGSHDEKCELAALDLIAGFHLTGHEMDLSYLVENGASDAVKSRAKAAG